MQENHLVQYILDTLSSMLEVHYMLGALLVSSGPNYITLWDNDFSKKILKYKPH